MEKDIFESVSQGNYGGPLFTAEGKIIGIAIPSPKKTEKSPFYLRMSHYKFKILQWIEKLDEIKNYDDNLFKHL